MSRLTGSEAKSMMEAYNSVYASNQTQESLEQEILEAISYTLISQGYTAIDVLEYFANVEEEVIIEDLIALSEGTLIFEEVVSEEYVDEQLQQLDEIIGAALRIGSAAMKAAKYAPKAASLGQKALSALGGAGKAATRVAQQGTKASAVVRPALGKAVQAVKGAASGAKSAIGGAVSKLKGAASGALNKLPGGSQGRLAKTAKMVGKAALGGAAFEAGMRGAGALANKVAGGGGKPSSAKTTWKVAKASGSSSPYNMKNLGAAQYSAFKAGGGDAAMKSKGQTAGQVVAQGRKNLGKYDGGPRSGSAPTPAPKPAPAPAPKPAPAPAPKPASSPSATKSTPAPTKAPTPTEPKAPSIKKDVEDIKQMQQRSKQRQGAEMGGPEGPGTIDKSSVESDIKAAQEREKKKASSATKTESYDVYDVILEYLFDNGHVETVEEAHYVMMEMDTETIAAIIEEKGQVDEAQKPLPAKKMQARRMNVYMKTGEAAGSSRNERIRQVLDAHKKDPEGEAAKARAKSKYKG
jgi:uncharacterized protein YjgD (DUF1641 family)